MILAKYRSKGREFSLCPCTKDDIEEDINKVKKYWIGLSLLDRYIALEKCVESNTACYLLDDTDKKLGAFYWTTGLDSKLYTDKVFGQLLWIEPIKNRYIAIGADYLIRCCNIHSVFFRPTVKFIPFRSILDRVAIQQYKKEGIYLTVNFNNPVFQTILNSQRKYFERV